jgi:membrane protease YdiL (CAAX protease family)
VVGLSAILLSVQVALTLAAVLVLRSTEAAYISVAIGSLVLVAGWLRWRMRLSITEVGFRCEGVRTVRVVAVGSAVGLLWVSIRLILSNSFHESFDAGRLYPLFLAIAFCSILLNPICEEAIYRGLYYRPLRARWGIGPALLVQAVIFTALHLDFFSDGWLERSVERALIGIALGVVYEVTRNLYASAACHASINFGSFLGDLLLSS